MLPHAAFWRPWDALFGTFLNQNTGMFPTLNHVVIYAAHVMGTFLVFTILKKIWGGKFCCWAGGLFFFFSPAMLGAILGCDTLNQTYATFWGLAALYSYLFVEGILGKVLWLAFAFVATFSKENGLAWFVVPPLFAYGMTLKNERGMINDWVKGGTCVFVYFVARHLLSSGNGVLEVLQNDDSPYVFTLKNKLLDFVFFLSSIFTTVDPIAIVPEEQRNIFWASLSILLSLPLMIFLIVTVCKQHDILRFVVCTFGCIFITALPHLATHFGPLHAYAPLPMTALLVGSLFDKGAVSERMKRIVLGIFILMALMVDIHHWWEMLKSSHLAITMSRNAIKTLGGEKPKSIYFISKYSFKRYSAFVIPCEEQFVYGSALQFYNRYDWPLKVNGETIKNPTKKQIDSIAYKKKRIYDCVMYSDKEKFKLVYLKKGGKR